nr:hypothetical protein [Tanacetum cinerariifolium]
MHHSMFIRNRFAKKNMPRGNAQVKELDDKKHSRSICDSQKSNNRYDDYARKHSYLCSSSKSASEDGLRNNETEELSHSRKTLEMHGSLSVLDMKTRDNEDKLLDRKQHKDKRINEKEKHKKTRDEVEDELDQIKTPRMSKDQRFAELREDMKTRDNEDKLLDRKQHKDKRINEKEKHKKTRDEVEDEMDQIKTPRMSKDQRCTLIVIVTMSKKIRWR